MLYVSQLLQQAETKTYTTQGGIIVRRKKEPAVYDIISDELPKRLNKEKGALFSSSFEYTGRYTRWDIGFVNPLLEITTQGYYFSIKALNARGVLILKMLKETLASYPNVVDLEAKTNIIQGTIQSSEKDGFDETERTKLPSVFDVLRLIQGLFFSKEDAFLGLYGAFGFDLIYQFEKMTLSKPRHDEHRDMQLYLPDEIYVMDRKQDESYCIRYEFIFNNESTEQMPRIVNHFPNDKIIDAEDEPQWAYKRGAYAELVRQALPAFRKGDLFEVVPSQVIKKQTDYIPSEIYHNLKEQNPSPYGFMINLGVEHLIGASPEMYVRVEGNKVETCPISGTIKRGEDPIEDAENIRKLLNSTKDEAELTMCTDVDRNDKSRICVPGTVKVIGRRQIEMYSKLFHTVDHITGELRPEFDGIDAFITHMWAVTVTGAPKIAAVKWIEEHEETPREWYGGAVGWIAFNGNINTGLTLRTAKISGRTAEMRVGATLLHASIPEEEEEETLVKVKALSLALESKPLPRVRNEITPLPGNNKKVLLVDHEDSFVHTLGSYLKQTGAMVVTMRSEQARKVLSKQKAFDLVVLSPGPSTPGHFQMKKTIELCLKHNLPLFGVCLGFQGIVEYFGGQLGVLPRPAHGERTEIEILEASPLFSNFPNGQMRVGRYHSLYVENLPECLTIMAKTSDGINMAIKHNTLPIYGVQFHPESILSIQENKGYQLICNLIESL
jgi:anthranilate synthase